MELAAPNQNVLSSVDRSPDQYCLNTIGKKPAMTTVAKTELAQSYSAQPQTFLFFNMLNRVTRMIAAEYFYKKHQNFSFILRIVQINSQNKYSGALNPCFYIDYRSIYRPVSGGFKSAFNMNRTFLIFLMIGTALMIAVTGGKRSSTLPGYMPWEVRVLPGGNTRVFGITLNKTRIQDANQILGSFPKNRLITEPHTASGLYAVYEQVNLGGFLAELALQYDNALLEQTESMADVTVGTGYVNLPDQLQLELLNSRVKGIIYTPAVDYTPELVLQHFGQADEQHELEQGRQRWLYRDMGLNIFIDPRGPENFIYKPVKPAATDKQNMPASEIESVKDVKHSPGSSD